MRIMYIRLTIVACGGLQRLSVFNNTNPRPSGVSPPGLGPTPRAAGAYAGCATDKNIKVGRALTGSSYTSPNMTLVGCRQFCDTNGYFFSGTEYSDQCFCGNHILNNNTILGSNATCTMICAGNRNETCGGPNRMSVFNSTHITAPKQPASTQSTANKQLGTSSTDPSQLSAPSNADTGIYWGCVTDSISARTLNSSKVLMAPNMTLAYCRSFCDSMGYFLSGTEYSDECHCGSALLSGGTVLESNSTCDMPCSGDSTESCGGSNRLTVYNSTNVLQNITVAAGVYLGCYSDPDTAKGRSLDGATLTASNMTLEMCRAFCDAQGLPLSGTEYGVEWSVFVT